MLVQRVVRSLFEKLPNGSKGFIARKVMLTKIEGRMAQRVSFTGRTTVVLRLEKR